MEAWGYSKLRRIPSNLEFSRQLSQNSCFEKSPRSYQMHKKLTLTDPPRSLWFSLFLLVALSLNLHAWSLGPIGGEFEEQSGSNYLKVTSVTSGAPGALAGMQVGDYTIASCDYGQPFTAALQAGNYYGVQFHPERSSKVGSKLIQNFLEL